MYKVERGGEARNTLSCGSAHLDLATLEINMRVLKVRGKSTTGNGIRKSIKDPEEVRILRVCKSRTQTRTCQYSAGSSEIILFNICNGPLFLACRLIESFVYPRITTRHNITKTRKQSITRNRVSQTAASHSAFKFYVYSD